MKILAPVLLLLQTLSPVLCGQEPAESAPTLSAELAAEHDLLSISENFNGATSLQQIKQLLEQNTNPNTKDTQGNTPILLLCRSIELDYRYRHEAHYAQAVDSAFVLLLSRGADALHENAAGCNALFYLQSKPELLKKLQQNNLLPKELSVSIPYGTLAMLRYMKLRVEQAELTTHEECRQYLIKKYCAPAYSRVESKITDYLHSESRKHISQSSLDCYLAFLRLADAARAEAYINNLHYWQHSEHFIEDTPASLLSSLHRLHWNVAPEQLRTALLRLNTQLPREGEDMISCNAARPMVQVLEMLEQSQGEAVHPLVREYTESRDPELAYHAYRILLRHHQLPTPEPTELESLYSIKSTPNAVPQEIKKLYICAKVDEAMRLRNLDGVQPDELKYAAQQYQEMGLQAHADTVSGLIQQDQLTTDTLTRQSAFHRYSELVSPAPRATLARYIFEHPALFRNSAPSHR